MTEKTKICPICGRSFTATGKKKYCSRPCQEEAHRQTMAAWKEAHNYNDRLREQRQAEREQKTAEEAATIKARFEKVQQEAAERERERKKAEQKERKELLERAKTGDPYAIMKTTNDPLEYWRCFALVEIARCEAAGYRADVTVNGIDAYSPTFAEDVLESIAESGQQYIRRQYGAKIKL